MIRSAGLWRRSLLGAGLLVLLGTQASGFTAYVSNEKSNTISVIDTDKFQVVKTIKVGQRPARHRADQGRKVHPGCGGRRRHDSDDRCQPRTRSSRRCRPGPTPSCSRRIRPARFCTWRTRTPTPSRSSIWRSACRSARCKSASSRKAWASVPDGKILVNTSETTNMAHFIDTQTREIVAQRAGRCAASLCGVQARRLGTLGIVRGRRNGEHHRSRQARGEQEDHLRHTRACARRQSSRSESTSPRTARPGSWRSGPPTASPWSTAQRMRFRSICSSASASGTWRSPRTRNIS